MVDTALMTPEEVAWLDTYHQQVRAGVRRPPPAHSPSLPLIHGGLLAGVGGGVSPPAGQAASPGVAGGQHAPPGGAAAAAAVSAQVIGKLAWQA